MIERIGSGLKKSLEQIPYINHKIDISCRFKVADGVLADGRVYPVIFVDQQDLYSVSLESNQLAAHSEKYKRWQHALFPGLSLSVSKIVEIRENYTAIPVNLQSKVHYIGPVRGTDIVFFNAVMGSGRIHQCIISTSDPYYFVKLPGDELSSDIVDVTPLSIDCLNEAIYSTEIKPSLCVYIN